jgi:dTDP-4-amino-4,6-dideoxygalactose transaminase
MNNINVHQREYKDLQVDIDRKLRTVCLSGSYILGKEVECFEKEFASYLHVKHVIGVGNGMEALQVGMMAGGIGKGDEVITTPLSAVATTLAITSLGATPVFVDIDQYFHMNVLDVEKRITKKTRAIVPVHLYGQAVDIAKISTLAKKYGLYLFEDACQAHGAEYKKTKTGDNEQGPHRQAQDGEQDARVGTFGMFGAFSFYPTKNLGCYGDGGAVTTNDSLFAGKCQMLRNYGQKDRYIHTYRGLNSRLDEMQAGILRVKLSHLDVWNKRRRAIADQYSSLLQGVGDIQTPMEREGAMHVYHQYVIRTKKRNALLRFLYSHSIKTLIHYPVPIHKQPCCKEFNNIHLPHVEKVCNEIISLPIHPYMTDNEVIHKVDIIKKFFR